MKVLIGISGGSYGDWVVFFTFEKKLIRKENSSPIILSILTLWRSIAPSIGLQASSRSILG